MPPETVTDWLPLTLSEKLLGLNDMPPEDTLPDCTVTKRSAQSPAVPTLQKSRVAVPGMLPVSVICVPFVATLTTVGAEFNSRYTDVPLAVPTVRGAVMPTVTFVLVNVGTVAYAAPTPTSNTATAEIPTAATAKCFLVMLL